MSTPITSFTSVLLLIASFFLVSCNGATDPDPGSNGVDPALIGVWYRTTTPSTDFPNTSHPAPKKAITGLQFTADDLITLGVESSTGKLAATSAQSYIVGLISARDGVLIRSVSAPPAGIVSDTLYYEVRHDSLILTFPNDYKNTKQTFRKTEMDATVAEPVPGYLNVVFDARSDNPQEAYPVYPYPSAYASRVSSSSLLLVAKLPGTDIAVEIEDFKGVGEYSIRTQQPILRRRFSDYFELFVNDSTQAGQVTIDEYDEALNICSGTFSISVTAAFSSERSYNLSEGSFSVPLYR